MKFAIDLYWSMNCGCVYVGNNNKLLVIIMGAF